MMIWLLAWVFAGSTCGVREEEYFAYAASDGVREEEYFAYAASDGWQFRRRKRIWRQKSKSSESSAAALVPPKGSFDAGQLWGPPRFCMSRSVEQACSYLEEAAGALIGEPIAMFQLKPCFTHQQQVVENLTEVLLHCGMPQARTELQAVREERSAISNTVGESIYGNSSSLPLPPPPSAQDRRVQSLNRAFARKGLVPLPNGLSNSSRVKSIDTEASQGAVRRRRSRSVKSRESNGWIPREATATATTITTTIKSSPPPPKEGRRRYSRHGSKSKHPHQKQVVNELQAVHESDSSLPPPPPPPSPPPGRRIKRSLRVQSGNSRRVKSTDPEASQAQKFSVLTYNLWGYPRLDDKRHVLSSIRVKKSMKALIKKVKELKPWVVALQEYNPRAFDPHLKPFWQKYKACKTLQNGVALTVRNDVICRTSLVQSFERLRQCDKYSRQYQSVEIEVNGSWIEVAGLHLKSGAGVVSHRCRGASLGQSFTNVIKTKRRGIVMGDMNWYCGVSNGPDVIKWNSVRHFEKFRDVFRYDRRASFPSWNTQSDSACRLDRIFFTSRGLKVVKRALVNKRVARDDNVRLRYQYLSDHFGLFAVFKVERLESPRRTSSAESHLKAGRHYAQSPKSEQPTIYGKVFVQQGLGLASYHFDSEDDCYISYSAAPVSWAVKFGRSLPAKKNFENSKYDAATRTFHGTVNWDPPFGNSTRWEYRMVFNAAMTYITSGENKATEKNGNIIERKFGEKMIYSVWDDDKANETAENEDER